ncbi:uncharacterized protein PGTG_13664 [Puccinia graminis f. sp. tritici CRL 75-36-700-3]|uniref:Uncharacterized protein n=1 Tax=Puccinia graminis f. sp. tritici (strain CRL 75-36-700-3 / race SCCL) TaxID=418459 RepID=E3KT50_PUCGT|nr:uncharacterized protein PGTG_13664 [Puccinia graminis f. sp. tritici CRL 75-36-700-3]EFP87436.1 hypothetical protein PGTG_13664 [Puccinia graminis f. sp. tritici CRL 75-36-700-3]
MSRFLGRFEAAADGEGADEEVLRNVEDMKGYEKKDWAELKKEMLEKWGQSKQRYREADLDRLAEEMAEKGRIQMREQYGNYQYPGSGKQTFIKAFSKEMRE